MRTLLIAIGNELRQDDGAAHVLARELPAWLGWNCRCVVQLTPELAAEMSGYQRVIFADADVSAEEAGLGPVPPQQGELFGQIHQAGAAELTELARLLYGFSGEALLCRIPAVSFRFEEGLTETASAGVEAALTLLEAAGRRA